MRRFWSRCGSTSLGRGGGFADLKEQFHSGRTLGCQWCNLADGNHSSKSWYFVGSHRRWSDLLCSRRCLHDHLHQTLEREMLQHTPQLAQLHDDHVYPNDAFAAPADLKPLVD